MEATEFIKIYKRMMKTSGYAPNINADENSPEKILTEIKKWAEKHPIKTRQSEFLKQWPSVSKDNHGVCNLEPCNLCPELLKSSRCTPSNCKECRYEFWLKEVE